MKVDRVCGSDVGILKLRLVGEILRTESARKARTWFSVPQNLVQVSEKAYLQVLQVCWLVGGPFG
jgi:hypothetical protein